MWWKCPTKLRGSRSRAVLTEGSCTTGTDHSAQTEARRGATRRFVTPWSQDPRADSQYCEGPGQWKASILFLRDRKSVV